MRSSLRAQDVVAGRIAAPPRRLLGFLPRAALVLDVLVMVGVAATALVVRSWLGWFSPGLAPQTVRVAAPLMVLGWVGLIAVLGGYRERVFGSGVEEYRVMVNSVLGAAGLTGVVCYIVGFELSRSFYVLVVVLGAVCLVGGRYLLRRALHRARRGNALTHDVVIAGSVSQIEVIAGVLRRETWLGYRILGAVVPPGSLVEETPGGTPVLGSTEELVEVLTAVNADVVVVTGGALEGADQMRALVWELEALQIRVVVAPSVTDVARQRVHVRPVGGLPLLHIDPPRHVRASRRAKRAFDVVCSCVLLLVVAPGLLFIALVVRLYDHGPVLFRQVRTGRDGLEFWCLKFRTMVVDAEDRLAALEAGQGLNGLLFKMKDDPRITGPGRWLRRFSLDELPQLVNVLRGEMSLVGPRPPLPAEVAAYDGLTRRRLRVRPGMTGLWQVSGRSDLSWSEAIRLDLYYVDNWSMLQDVSILAKTLGAVLGSRGAY